MNRNNIVLYLLIFLSTFLLLQSFQSGNTPSAILSSGDIGLESKKDRYAVGKDIQVEVMNNTDSSVTLEAPCDEPILTVNKFNGSGFEVQKKDLENSCGETSTALTLEPHKKKLVNLGDYSYSYFGEPGLYKVSTLATVNGTGTVFESPDFEVKKPSVLTGFWRTVIYVPMLNLLVAILEYTPGHHLAWAVIILTFLVRTLLLVPSQRAIRAQKQMQEMQPRIDELKKRYANDQARLAQETLLLWKTHKVHPLSSCLPVLIQIPILIALYLVIQSGLKPDKAVLIYDFLPSFSLGQVQTIFLGFDLLERSVVVFPLIVGGLQFLQMQLMMAKKKSPSAAKLPSEFESANKMMKYIMPIMIAVFTAQLPAAVGLYWGTSTLYGIVQQLVVNREGPKTPSKHTEDVEVRVVHKQKHQ